MSRLIWAVPIAGLFALGLAIGFLLGHSTAGSTTPAASVRADAFPPCREDPLGHVRNPTSLLIVSDCASVRGTVQRVEFQISDGDYRLFVKPDQEDADVLAASNDGLLVVEIVPVDQPSVFLPNVGQHATFYGALVQDSGHDGWVEIHPTWLITSLDVAVTVPPSAPVGELVSIGIEVSSTEDGETSPISEANVFLELLRDGTAMRWEAARTSTLGVATISLASLEVAGEYTLHVYASRDRDSGIGEASFRIRRR